MGRGGIAMVPGANKASVEALAVSSPGQGELWQRNWEATSSGTYDCPTHDHGSLEIEVYRVSRKPEAIIVVGKLSSSCTSEQHE